MPYVFAVILLGELALALLSLQAGLFLLPISFVDVFISAFAYVTWSVRDYLLAKLPLPSWWFHLVLVYGALVPLGREWIVPTELAELLYLGRLGIGAGLFVIALVSFFGRRQAPA